MLPAGCAAACTQTLLLCGYPKCATALLRPPHRDKWEADIDFDEILRLPGEKQSQWHDLEAAEVAREREQAAAGTAGAPGSEGNGANSR